MYSEFVEFEIVVKALRIASFHPLGSVLKSVKGFRLPSVHGKRSWYGEQMFNVMVHGVLKRDDTAPGRPIYVPLKNQGFDVRVILPVKLPIYTREQVVYVEIKTIYMGEIIPLSPSQDRLADYIAIYNPRGTEQKIFFRDIERTVPPQSYRILKL